MNNNLKYLSFLSIAVLSGTVNIQAKDYVSCSGFVDVKDGNSKCAQAVGPSWQEAGKYGFTGEFCEAVSGLDDGTTICTAGLRTNCRAVPASLGEHYDLAHSFQTGDGYCHIPLFNADKVNADKKKQADIADAKAKEIERVAQAKAAEEAVLVIPATAAVAAQTERAAKYRASVARGLKDLELIKAIRNGIHSGTKDDTIAAINAAIIEGVDLNKDDFAKKLAETIEVEASYNDYLGDVALAEIKALLQQSIRK